MGPGATPGPFFFAMTLSMDKLIWHHKRVGDQVAWKGNNWNDRSYMTFAGTHRRGAELIAKHRVELKSILTYATTIHGGHSRPATD